MKTVFFILADSVEMYEAGKMVIVGTFDIVKSGKIPFFIRPFSLALKLRAGAGDYDESYDAQVILRKLGTKKRILDLPLTIKFGMRKRILYSNFASILHINVLKFESYGKYIFELIVDSDVVCSIVLSAIKVKTVKKKKKKKK